MEENDVNKSADLPVQNEETLKQKLKEERDFRIKAAIFLGGVTGISMLAGFGSTLAAAKKRDPDFFNKGLSGSVDIPADKTHIKPPTRIPVEPGASLALRALGWGTLYSVAGCSLLFYGIWKMMGVNNLTEFRTKVGGMLPSIPKNNPPRGRTEFSGLNDLLQYIIDVDSEEKSKKAASK